MNDGIKNFNLRVYGLLVKNNQVLISREQFRERNLLKFPGGGIEYGEGILEALQREWQEEVGVIITIKRLFYITDYFIQSAFCKEDQIVSFYYLIETKDNIVNGSYEHDVYWMHLNEKNLVEAGDEPVFTFPQDQKVFNLLQSGNI